jgi:hypothetical protein
MGTAPETRWDSRNVACLSRRRLGNGPLPGPQEIGDLDFFFPDGLEEADFINQAQSKKLDLVLLHQTSAHTVLLVDKVKVDLIRERIPLRFPLRLLHPQMTKLKMADPRDIGRMKILSIGSRGGKKDFIDLFCLTREVISLETLLAMAMEESHGIRYSKIHFLKGIVDFEEADLESEPAMIWNVSWAEIKDVLLEEVKEIAKKIVE